ncbi:MAG: hypothetical protein LBR89_01055 [Holosporales bacterium]|nr:hypothetical protein [Holosporales bacterium]
MAQKGFRNRSNVAKKPHNYSTKTNEDPTKPLECFSAKLLPNPKSVLRGSLLGGGTFEVFLHDA